MSHVKTLRSVVCVTMLLTAAAASAQSNLNRTTYLTFSTPVELPGVTLPAGTYTFRLSDSTSDRHVVQVLDKDGAKLHTRILAVPAKRLHVDEETVVTFHELPAEATPAVRYWYYPGDEIGQEFAYPKDQALRLAAASGEPVLAVDAEDASMTAQMTRVEPDAADQPPADTTAQPDTHPRDDGTRAAGTSRTERLPQTASNLPLVGLLGLLSLGGAIAVRATRAFV
jgi:hypothetical protein